MAFFIGYKYTLKVDIKYTLKLIFIFVKILRRHY